MSGGRMDFRITKSHRDEDGTLVIDSIEPDRWPSNPDTITITISRAQAKRFTDAYWDPDKECDCAACQVVPVIRAALEEKQ